MEILILIICILSLIICPIISFLLIKSAKIELSKKIDENKNDSYSKIVGGVSSSNEITQTAIRLYGEQVSGLDGRMNDLRRSQEERLDSIRLSFERSFRQMQEDNQKKLDEIRLSVDEKLQKTLEERVSESFKLVGNQLEQVHKSLGEMQTLATGVGDLKKILTNVKTRGVFGEVQLSRILEQILTKDQYVTNFATKKGSRNVVEFAVKLPGKSDYDEPIYLPLDSKFPLDVYNSLLDAYDGGDSGAIEMAGKMLEAAIRKNAKDIQEKYIDPPNTTDFAVMFLPTEGLYAEVVRRTSLIERLAAEFNVNVVGPSTVSAFLNSLQMGFRTLAIEKRSHEVWNLLGAVKTEFANYENVLSSVKKKFSLAESELDNLLGVRTRAVMRKLKNVEELPEDSARLILSDSLQDGDAE